MAIINGGGVSGVSPKKFDEDIGEVKNDLSTIKTGVADIQSDMTQLVTDVNDAVENIQTTVENAPVGGPLPFAMDTNCLSSSSTEEGIKISYKATITKSASGAENISAGSIVPYGIMIRISDTGYPRTPNEGNLVVDDTDIVDITSDYGTGGTSYGKKKTVTAVGLESNKKYYISAFPYSYAGVFNVNYGVASNSASNQTANRTECTWTGTKGTLTVTITQDYDYKTLGEITVTATPTAGGDPVSASRTGAGNVALSLDGGEYTVSFSSYNYYTAPENQTINVTAGQNNTASAEYKAVVGLDNYTWEDVHAISAGGDAEHFFSIGESKETTVGTITNGMILSGGQISGVNIVEMQLDATIVAINEHETTNGTNKNVTFCVLDLPLYVSEQMANKNYKISYLRKCLNERKDEFLPYIYQYLIEVNNAVAGFDQNDNNRKMFVCNDYVYVPSTSNISGNSVVFPWEINNGGTRYPYFSSMENRILKTPDGSTSRWATSTTSTYSSGTIIDVSTVGHILYSNSSSMGYTRTNTVRYPMCFNVG